MTKDEALRITLEALRNVPVVGEVYDQQHSDTHLRAILLAEDILAQPEQCTYPNCDYPCMNLPDCKEPEQEPVAKKMTAHRAAYFMERFKHEEKLLGPNEQAALDFVISMLEAQPEQEPVLVVEKEPDYMNGGHYHEGTKPHIDPTKVWKLPIGTKLYTHPPVPTAQQEQELTNLERHERNVQQLFGTPQPKEPEQEPAEKLAYKADYWKRMHDEVRVELIKVLNSLPPEQEPVAWVVYSSAENDIVWADKGKRLKQNTPLYTTPPQSKPLTDEDKAILDAVHRELDRNCDEGNAPGHSHRIKGVWDEDNGKLAGKPCAWCLTWAKFTVLIENEAAHGITASEAEDSQKRSKT